MPLEHRKQRAVRLLQAVENRAKQLAKLMEDGTPQQQLEVLSELSGHLDELKKILLQNYVELCLQRCIKTDEVEQTAEEFMAWMNKLREI